MTAARGEGTGEMSLLVSVPSGPERTWPGPA
jgi:hypothetical protein